MHAVISAVALPIAIFLLTHMSERFAACNQPVSAGGHRVAVDGQRVGRIVRALRRRRGWRQRDLGHAAICSQTMVSLMERGHLEHISLPVLRRTLAALDASLVLDVRWRVGALDRLLDEDHATLLAEVARTLRATGWLVEVEVTYSEYGERGSYDILAFHPDAGIVLIVEIKTDIASAEATLRKLDEKVRLAPKVARERFGWAVRHASRLLVLPESSTLRRRVARQAALFGTTLPRRGVEIRRWVTAPQGELRGLWFLSRSGVATLIQRRGGRERVRRRDYPPASDETAA